MLLRIVVSTRAVSLSSVVNATQQGQDSARTRAPDLRGLQGIAEMTSDRAGRAQPIGIMLERQRSILLRLIAIRRKS